MKYRIVFAALALMSLAFVGCSKKSGIAAAMHSKIPDLGVVEVSDGIQSRHDLGGGRVCIIMPTILKDGSILLSMRIEESGELRASPRVQTKNDMPVSISIGEAGGEEIGVALTPRLKK